MFEKVLVAIFTYNEEKNISSLLKEVSKKFKNILVVDNNSEDDTLKIVSKFSIKFVHHKYNLGKSNSMKTALDYARINQFDYLAFIDGDGQHSVYDLEKICSKLQEMKDGLVIGYRKDLDNLNIKKRVGTKILNKIFLLLYGTKILDIQCGLRAFNTRDKKIDWSSTGLMHYFADAEITCNAIKNKCNITQIPIKTIISENYKGMNVLQGLFLVIMVFYWRIF